MRESEVKIEICCTRTLVDTLAKHAHTSKEVANRIEDFHFGLGTSIK
jgi:hypothetical protein